MKQLNLIILALSLSLNLTAMEIKTQITINASPDKVWHVLTNFKDYPTWNPFIKSIQGKAVVGKKIKVEFEKMKFTPKVLVFDTNREFQWLGHLLFPGLFDGKHHFQLIDNGDGTTTLLHSEKFKGILVGVFKKKLLTETRNDFEQMNQALKEKVEKI